MIIDFRKTFDQHHITKAEIARATGASKQLVNQWYNGKCKPKPQQSDIIIQLFKDKGIEPIFFC